MCNKGEMNKEMSDIVKLAADAIQNTKENLISNPSIFIILNMISKINDEVQLLKSEIESLSQLTDSKSKAELLKKQNKVAALE